MIFKSVLKSLWKSVKNQVREGYMQMGFLNTTALTLVFWILFYRQKWLQKKLIVNQKAYKPLLEAVLGIKGISEYEP